MNPMFSGDVLWNLLLMFLCYGYVVLIIAISSKLTDLLGASQRTSRKFLHAMIGNLVFVIPFFTSNIYPALVAAPFILLTFLASPYTPLKNSKLLGLANITEEGHPLGLVFYAISYTALVLLFASRPSVVAAGMLPMAYGDSAASLVGEKYGKRRYRFIPKKSVEGTIAMLFGSLASLAIGLGFFSTLHSLPVVQTMAAVIVVVIVVSLVEIISPKGFDNLTVPIMGALTFWFLSGGS